MLARVNIYVARARPTIRKSVTQSESRSTSQIFASNQRAEKEQTFAAHTLARASLSKSMGRQ